MGDGGTRHRQLAFCIEQVPADVLRLALRMNLALRLKQNAQSLADFLDNTLDRSAFESGRVVLNETEFSLNEVLSAECSRLLPLAELKHLKLTWHGPEPPISLKADRTKLVRILTNLLTNAIKFTETGEVIVEATLPRSSPISD